MWKKEARAKKGKHKALQMQVCAIVNMAQAN